MVYGQGVEGWIGAGAGVLVTLVCVLINYLFQRRLSLLKRQHERERKRARDEKLLMLRRHRDELERLTTRLSRDNTGAGTANPNFGLSLSPARDRGLAESANDPEPAYRRQRYRATRRFQIGNSERTIPEGAELEFDGRTLFYGEVAEATPQLRGAISEGWLVPIPRGGPEEIAEALRRINPGTVERPARGWTEAFDQLLEGFQHSVPSLQEFNQQLRTLGDLVDNQEAFNARVEAARKANRLPPGVWERLTQVVEKSEPRWYEVAEQVVVDGQGYEPGAVINAEDLAHLPPENVRKFVESGCIIPHREDLRRSRYDRLTDDEP